MNSSKYISAICILLLLAFSIYGIIYFTTGESDCGAGETCTEIKDCPSALELISNRKQPRNCSFVGKVPYVCCEDKIAVISPNIVSPQEPLKIENSIIDELKLRTTTIKNVINDSSTIDTSISEITFASTTLSIPVSTPAITKSIAVGSPSESSAIEKSKNKNTTTITIAPNETTIIDATILEPTTITPPTSAPAIQHATGFKATQQCDKNYDRIPVDINGYVISGSYVNKQKPTKTEENAHAAALGHQEGDKIEWLCAGSLISETFVLTAAHCIDNNNINYIRLGDLNLNESNDPVEPQNFTVARTFLNPKYKKPLRYHDLGLIELDRPVVISKYVKPICLKFKPIISETNLHIVGYNNNNAKNYLYNEVISNADRRICQFHFKLKQYKEFLPNGVDYETQFCGNGLWGGALCQLDTGGAVQVYNWAYTDGTLLIGVTSIEKLCNGKNAPGLYTKTSNYIPWIESVVWPDND